MKKIYILLILMSSFCSAQNINFTIDTAIDNGTSITETIVVGPDTFVLTVFHSGNEELDNLGGGDLIFFHSAIDPLTPHMLSITKNGVPTNFNLNSIDYDTLGAGQISLTNQNGDIISAFTNYSVGAGTLNITNPANAQNISQVNILPFDNDDLNDFGFHNINVDIATACTAPDVPTITSAPPTICDGNSALLNISGNKGDATQWFVYTGSCGGTLVATTAGSSVIVTPTPSATTYYVRGEGGCVTPGACGTITVTTTAREDASFSYDASSYCADGADPTPTVTGVSGGSFSSGGGLSLNASTGTIDVSASTPSTYTVTYTTSGLCNGSESVTVTINALDDASFSYGAASYCQTEADPSPTITGLAGGTFSSSPGLSINPGTGAIDVSASTSGAYTVTYTTAGTCPNSSGASVTINASDDASFSYDAASYCADNADPTPTVTGLAGGTFSSTAGLSINAGTGSIDLSASTPGSYTVTYTTAGSCPNASNLNVTVNALDDASFSYDAPSYCLANPDPTPTITGLAGGTFTSTAGLSINAATGTIDVSASTPGSYTVTYTTAGTCPNSSSVSVTVNALDDASFNYDAAAYCADDADPTPTVTGLPGGTFSSGAGLSINASTGTIDVSTSTPGSYTVTYTTAGSCANSSSLNVTVNALDDASFTYDAAAYCADDVDPTPTVTGLPGGTFSADAGLSINASTGAIDVSTSTPGSYTVTYTTTGICPNSSSVSVTLNALDDASFSYDASSYFADDADPTPTVTGTPGGTFSSTAGLVINASTGTIDVSASTLGTYTVTYITSGVCPNASNASITIEAIALANDECTGAIAVTCGEIVMGSTVGATDSGNNASNDVFYSFTDTVEQYVTLSLCNSDYDSYVRVFDDCPQTNQIALNDDSCAAQSEVTFLAAPNTTYYIMIEGFAANNGNYEMEVTCAIAANDECTDAIAITCFETVTGSTLTATDSGSNASNDVFYSFTDTVLQDVTLSLCNSNYDTFIRVFDDCPQTNQIAGNDDSLTCPGNQSELTFTAQPNVTYYIMIEGFNASNGNYEMSVDCIENIPAPGNDLCVNATPLTLGVTLVDETTAGATDDSTSNLDDTTCDSFNFHSDVWYTFQAPVSGLATVTTEIFGNSDQANVAIYSSTDCSQLDADSIACSEGNGGEVVNLTGLTANATYSVRVWSDGVAAVERRTEGVFDITVTDATLSTSEIDNFQAFNYYPNPVKNELTLEAQHTIENVRVFNLLGQLVINETPNATSKNIDMTQLQAGAYFVEVTIGNATKTIRVIRE